MHCASGTFFFTTFVAFAVGNAGNKSPHLRDVPMLNSNGSTLRIAVPFGSLDVVQFSEPFLVQKAGTDFDIGVVASDEQWDKYWRKGLWYNCLLDMTIEAAGNNLGDTKVPPSAESRYQGDFQAEVQGWGWIETAMEYDSNCDFRDDPEVKYNNKIGTALTDLGLSLLPSEKGGDNECFSIEHEDEDDESDEFYNKDGKEWPYTGAYYTFAMNKKGGAIFVENLLSPAGALKNSGEGDISTSDLPELARCSDILWSYWLRDNQRPQDLDYFFANHVRNEDTLALISRVLRNHNINKVPRWPGLRIAMSATDALVILGKFKPPCLAYPAANVILGSPIGSIVAHLLFQHKAALGIKNLEYVTIFRDNHPQSNPLAEIPEVQLLFVTRNVPGGKTTNADMVSDAKVKRDIWVQHTDARNVIREHRVAVKPSQS